MITFEPGNIFELIWYSEWPLARFFLVDIVPIHLPTTFNASQFLHGLFTSHGHLLDLPDEEVSMWCKEPLKKLQRIECCQEVSSELCTFRNNTDTRSNPFFSGWHSSELTSRQRSMLRSFFTGSLHHMDTSSSGRSKRPPGWIWGFLQAVDTVARYVDCKSTTTWESALLNAY